MFQSARSRAEFVVHFHVENVGHLVEKRGKLHHGVGVLLEGQIEEVRVLKDEACFCDRVVRVLEGNAASVKDSGSEKALFRERRSKTCEPEDSSAWKETPQAASRCF